MRLIDIEAVLKAAELAGKEYVSIDFLKDFEQVDAVPVVRGEWEVAIGYDPNKRVQCQNCYKMAYEPTLYCPNCGCKMEGGNA